MKKIVIGSKEESIDYVFRETCFGILNKDNMFYITLKHDDYSLIGGGLEENESHEECLKREFLEEAGLKIIKLKKLCTIDCFWVTRGNDNMNSLSNIYIVEVSNEELEPLEKDSKLVKCDKDFLLEHICLPYQVEGLNQYFKINY